TRGWRVFDADKCGSPNRSRTRNPLVDSPCGIFWAGHVRRKTIKRSIKLPPQESATCSGSRYDARRAACALHLTVRTRFSEIDFGGRLTMRGLLSCVRAGQEAAN